MFPGHWLRRPRLLETVCDIGVSGRDNIGGNGESGVSGRGATADPAVQSGEGGHHLGEQGETMCSVTQHSTVSVVLWLFSSTASLCKL